MNLGTIIEALHDSEINGEVSWFYAGAWRVRLGDPINGFVAEAVVASAEEAAVARQCGEALSAEPVRADVSPLGQRSLSAYSGPPMTLGNAMAGHLRFVVWCLNCRHQVEQDPAEMVERYGAEMPVPDWHSRLVCGRCGSRNVDMVVTGERR